MNAIVLHAKSDADGMLHLEVDHPNAEYEVVVRQKSTTADAAKIDKAINDLHMTPAEQNEAARLSKLTRDPGWENVGDEDDLFE